MKRRKPAAGSWPKFDAPLHGEIAAAFSRRRRALGCGAKLSCERDFNETAHGTFERMNIDLLEGTNPRLNIRLSVWSDGAIWLGVWIDRRSRGVKRHLRKFHGDVLDVSPEGLLGLFESTRDRPDLTLEELKGLWAQVHPCDDRS